MLLSLLNAFNKAFVEILFRFCWAPMGVASSMAIFAERNKEVSGKRGKAYINIGGQ